MRYDGDTFEGNIFNEMVIRRAMNVRQSQTISTPQSLHCTSFYVFVFDFIYFSWWQIEFKLKSLFIGFKSKRSTSRGESGAEGLKDYRQHWAFHGIKKGLFMFAFFLLRRSWVIYEFLKYFSVFYALSTPFEITWSDLMTINIGIRHNLIVKGA